MNSESKSVISNFVSCFEKYKNRNIAIYGIGPITKLIVENVQDFHFAGLLDNHKKSGNLFGLNIIDEENLDLYHIDMIIIIARSSNVKLIYKRIEKKCKELQLEVYDINGRELAAEKETNITDHEYFTKSYEELIKIIEGYDVISFDIFDTLVTRKAFYPSDLFEILEKKETVLPVGFAALRVETERCLRYDKEPSIHEIYQKLAEEHQNAGFSWHELSRKEFELDIQQLIKRDRMVEVLDYCIKMKKKVYLVSDMYYTKDMLAELLDTLGITGYQDIFVSSEFGVSKATGLFEAYKNTVKAERYLHIGDDDYLDGECARKSGLACYLIRSPRDILEISAYHRLTDETDSLSKRLMIGMFTARIFNDPFTVGAAKGKGIMKDNHDFGYLFVAPFLVSFTKWLIRNLAGKAYDYILFSARDGYLLQKLYDCMRERAGLPIPESIYFYASRMACVSAAVETEEDLRFAAGLAFDGSPDQMLKDRFFVDDRDVLPYQNKEEEDAFSYLLCYFDKICRTSAQLRDNYLKYFKNLNIGDSSRLAFFDFVSSGTCQLCLQKIKKIGLDGYYIAFIKSQFNKEESVDALFELDPVYGSRYFICNNYLFLENILTAPEASLKRMDTEGNPVLLEEKRSQAQLETIKGIQDTVLEYLKEYMELYPFDLLTETDKELPDTILSYMTGQYTIDMTDLNSLGVLADEFCSREFDAYKIL